MKTQFLIVGAGFAGCTVARRLAEASHSVVIIDKRNHIGGNCYDNYDDYGIFVQRYGPHIFHTNLKPVWEFLSRFTEWNGYIHRVLANVNGMNVCLPINLRTMADLYNYTFSPEDLKEYFEKKRISSEVISNSKDVILSAVGEELYELFFKNYTKKQWGVFPEELDPQVTRRVPVRFSNDTRYFSDSYQGIPTYGFTRMFETMLNHKNIKILLNADFVEIQDQFEYEHLIFSGPIDEFFDYKYGRLPYRSLSFAFRTHDVDKFQDAGVVNFPNSFDYTRITEFKHFYFQKHKQTTICYEYPGEVGDPYYPMPTKEATEQYELYRKESQKLNNVHFVGRLAQYRYLNMDQVAEEGLMLAEKLLGL